MSKSFARSSFVRKNIRRNIDYDVSTRKARLKEADRRERRKSQQNSGPCVTVYKMGE